MDIALNLNKSSFFGHLTCIGQGEEAKVKPVSRCA